MKVFNFFTQIIIIFSFLTMGSLLILVAFHLLSLDVAISRVELIYESPWKSTQTGFLGFLFITVGLATTRLLIKKGRESEAVIYQSASGPVIVSVMAIEDAAKKVLKRYNLIKEYRVKTLIHSKDVEVRVRLVVWDHDNIANLLLEIQNEVTNKVKKLLGDENKVEIILDTQRIEDHKSEKTEKIQVV